MKIQDHPHSLYPRFRSINTIAHSYRNGTVRHKTKVRYGISDFVLLVKPKDDIRSKWTYVSLEHLPPLQLSPYDGNPSLNLPPGRTRIPSKRARPTSPENSERVTRIRVEDVQTSTSPLEVDTVPPHQPVNLNLLQVEGATPQLPSSPCPSFHSASSEPPVNNLN